MHIDLTTSDRPSDLVAARTLAEERRRREIQHLIEDPSSIDYVGGHRWELLRSIGDVATDALLANAHDPSRPSYYAFSALAALIMLESPAAKGLMIELLTRPDEVGSAWQLLYYISKAITNFTSPLGRELRALPELDTWLRKAIQQGDHSVRDSALCTAVDIGIELSAKELPPARKNKDDPDGRMAFWHSQFAPSPELFRTLVKRLQNDPPEAAKTWLWVALAAHPRSEDDSLARAAVQLAKAHIRTPRIGLDTSTSAAMDIVRIQGGDASAGGALGENASTPATRRIAAVEALAKRDRVAGLQRAKEMYRDEPATRAAAAAIIADLAGGSNDAELARWMTRVPIDSFNRIALSATITALLAIGGPEAELSARAVADLIDDALSLPSHWFGTDITPRTASRRLVELGIVNQAQADRGLTQYFAALTGHDFGHGDFLPEFFRGAGAWIAFDTESVDIPPRYDHLLLEFAKVSGGQFYPEAVSQGYSDHWQPEFAQRPPERIAVQFIHGDRLYRFTAKYDGDWFDVAPLFAAIDAALSDADAPGRFIPVDPEGQCDCFVFAPPEPFAKAVIELRLPGAERLAANARDRFGPFRRKAARIAAELD